MYYAVRQMAARDTQTFSARWGADVLDRLEQRSEMAGTNKSRLAERYVDEGTRMDEHPGIVFRGGPTGRRAALAGGPILGAYGHAQERQGARGGGDLRHRRATQSHRFPSAERGPLLRRLH